MRMGYAFENCTRKVYSVVLSRMTFFKTFFVLSKILEDTY